MLATLSPGQAGLFVYSGKDNTSLISSTGTDTGGGTLELDFLAPRANANADLVVKVDGVTKILTTDYTVTGAGTNKLTTVTFVSQAAAPADGASVEITNPAIEHVFKYVGRTFANDIELTDDHKITFGRGAIAGDPDMEIYHDSTANKSKIETLAGLEIDGLTYPTTDGTSGQVITTDGSGTLSFADAGGGFDPNVDQVVIGNGAAGNANPIFSSVAVGHDATASGTYAVGLGNQALATGADSVALGNDAHATGAQSVALGDDSVSGSNATIAIGNLANSSSAYGVAIGYNAQTSGAGNHYGVAIGRDAGAMAANTIHISSAATTTNRPTVAGNMVIETDDARLQYKSSTWGFYGGDVEIQNATPSLNLVDTDGTETKGSVGFNGSSLNLDARNGASDGPILFRGLGGGTATEYARFGGNGSLIMQIESIRMAGGSGTGMDFSGIGQAARTLDDYEEGTWTPNLAGSTTAGTFAGTFEGTYTKIGNIVTVQATVLTTSVTGSAGDLEITNLPFNAVNSSGRKGGAVAYCSGFGGTNHPIGCTVNAGGIKLFFWKTSSADCRAASITAVSGDAATLTNSVRFTVFITYEVN